MTPTSRRRWPRVRTSRTRPSVPSGATMRAVELIIDALRAIVHGVQRWPAALVDAVPLFKEGDRHSARKRILVLSLLTAAASVGCAERAPAGINCEKLRSLRAGMPIDQVRSLLGTPPLDYQQD